MQATGSGVVVIAGDTFRGGDSSFAYTGTLTEGLGGLRAELRVFRHSDGLANVFGKDDVTAVLTGNEKAGGATLSGNDPQAPGLTFSVTLTPLE